MKTATRTSRLVIRLAPEESARIKALAAALGTTKTRAVVRAVELALYHLPNLPKEAGTNGEEESAN